MTGGITISQPGEYVLGGDVTCLLPGDGIDIEASGVTLHLNGHTISGMCGSTLVPSPTGIHVNSTGVPTLTMVRIQGEGGTITGFQDGIVADNNAGSFAKSVNITTICPGAFGIFINSPSSQWKLQKDVVTNAAIDIFLEGDDNDLVLNDVSGANTSDGIFVNSNNNTIVNNTASMNGAVNSRGISVEGANNDLHANTTDNNAAFGIFVENGVGINNNITGNESSGNTTFDMDDENQPPFSASPCDNNKWKGNQFVSANASCIQ